MAYLPKKSLTTERLKERQSKLEAKLAAEKKIEEQTKLEEANAEEYFKLRDEGLKRELTPTERYQQLKAYKGGRNAIDRYGPDLTIPQHIENRLELEAKS